MSKAIIKVVNLNKIYHRGKESEVRAVDKVSFAIFRGAFVAVVGRSGSGKSSLMNLLGLLDKPTGGKYFLDGVDISGLDDKKLAQLRLHKIGFVFQSFNLLPRMSILGNVLLPTAYSFLPQKKKKALDIIESVGLLKYAYKRVDELSGGEKQRVAIARALINNPEIILADEPTGNLDVKTGREIMSLLRQLTQNGHTVILVTHDLELAKGVDRTITIEDGRIK